MVKTAIMVIGLAILTASLLTAGCSSDDDGEISGITQETLVDNVILAEEDIQTSKIDLEMTMNMNGSGGGETLTAEITVDGNGVVDDANQKMQMDMNMDMDMEMMGMDMDQQIEMEMYAIENMMYMKTAEMMGMPEQWIKSELPDDYWQSEDMIAQQTELLKEAVLTITDGGKVNGRDCYRVEMVPDMESLYEIMMQQPGMGGGTMEGLPEDMEASDIIDMIDSISVVQWYDKVNFFPMKADMEMIMSMSAEDLGMFGAQGDMEMSITMTMNFSDYNKPVTIELPAGAEDAIDMTEMYGTGEEWDSNW